MRTPLAAPLALILVGMFLVPLGALGAAVPTTSFREVFGGPHVTGSASAMFLAPTAVRSTNWAGYAATGTTGSVTSVAGSWTEPTVKCGSRTSLAAFWVGIDGYTSNTVEQTGTFAQCSHGSASHYVWWEMYPLNAVQVYGSISAGDQFTASVTYNSGSGVFTMAITDLTTNKLYETNSSQTGTQETSAECIAEAPSGGSSIYPLANFGKVSFGTCTATISGTSQGIGAFSSVYKITMVNSSSRTKASVSTLTSNSAFTVTWVRAT